MKTLAVSLLLLSTLAATAQTNSSPASTNITRLPEVTVSGRADNLVGIADSATQGTVGREQITRRPLARAAEVLETIPGVIVTQHSGAGKANQYFLRGFNLDHGTDFSVFLNGVPVNLPTHGHGQGWLELNPLIPELVDKVNYRKGVYFADVGDFSSAGTASIEYVRTLPASVLTLEGGSFNHARALWASSLKLGNVNLLYALEYTYADGPWTHGDRFNKGNAYLRYSVGDDTLGWDMSYSSYAGKWNATDQIAERALQLPGFSRFDSLDTSDGGNSQRHQLNAEWHRRDDSSASSLMAYGFFYDLDLFSNFTYFDASPAGDQFEQADRRWVGGLRARHTWFHPLLARESETSVGLDFRHDQIHNGLFNTVNRIRQDKPDYAAGIIPGTVRDTRIAQSSVSPWLENKTQWGEKFRTVAGLRGDVYFFDVNDLRPQNSGANSSGLISPKLTLVAGPWADTEVYLQGGLGFHSNDGRGTTTRVDPVTGLTVDANGDPIRPVDALVRSYGAEIGVRTTHFKNLHSTLSAWWLDIDSELLFVGDAGITEASRPSRRYGIEWANYYTPTKWLTLDADFSLSQARFRNSDPAGRHIPGSVEQVIAAGLSVQEEKGWGWHGGLRVRYFGPRALIEDDSVRSRETLLATASLGYRWQKTWAIEADVFNLLNRRDSEINYSYASRLAGEAASVNDNHFKPVDPLSVIVRLTAKF